MGKKSRKRANCFQVLGVEQNASISSLKEAFHSLSKKYHPDKQDQQDEKSLQKATAKFQEIKQAYEEAINDATDSEDDYDYDQHMYKRYQQPQSYFAVPSQEIEIKQPKVKPDEDEISTDEEIERRADQMADELFAYEDCYFTGRISKLQLEDILQGKPVKGKPVKALTGSSLVKNLNKFRIKQNYEKNEHELIAGCRSCDKWFEGIEGYQSHLRSDSHKKKSSVSRYSNKGNGMLKVTYDSLSSRQRQEPNRWRELNQETHNQVKATISDELTASATITESIEEMTSKALCEYIKNHSSDADPDLLIKCSSSAQFCNSNFQSVADYHRHHSRNVEEC